MRISGSAAERLERVIVAILESFAGGYASLRRDREHLKQPENLDAVRRLLSERRLCQGQDRVMFPAVVMATTHITLTPAHRVIGMQGEWNMTRWDRLNPALPQARLLALAGIIWTAVGGMLCRYACIWLARTAHRIEA